MKPNIVQPNVTIRYAPSQGWYIEIDSRIIKSDREDGIRGPYYTSHGIKYFKHHNDAVKWLTERGLIEPETAVTSRFNSDALR